MASENVDVNVTHDLSSLLTTEDRDFLVRNDGLQVKVESLNGKIIWLYYSASWSSPCEQFLPKLVEAYKELSYRDHHVEIVLVSYDEDDESFNEYFSKMPWLAIPFSDSKGRDELDEVFHMMGIPYLVMIDQSGKVVSQDGVHIIQDYGMEAYPFTPERIAEFKEMEEKHRKEQSLRSILVSQSCDYVISSDGKKVPISELEGKLVGLYFSLSSLDACLEFTPTLIHVYEKLRAKEVSFEIIMIPLDDEEEESFKQNFGSIPWLSLPFNDKRCEKLCHYFEILTAPTLVVIGTDGKTLHADVSEAIEEHGVQAYPFTPEKFAELEEIENAKQESLTLESILISEDRDFVIGKDGVKIRVYDLVGKNILLYFSAHWCPPCRTFLPKLIDVYNKIKEKDEAFEVIFISSDMDQASFDDYFSSMPWLALPFEDRKKKRSLNLVYKVSVIPTLIALGPTGRTLTTEAMDLVMIHGAEAYPFTQEHIKEMNRVRGGCKGVASEGDVCSSSRS